MSDLPIRHNALLDQYEVTFNLEARIVPIGEYGDEYGSMYSKPQRITIVLNEDFIDQVNDPEALIRYVHRQVQNVWTQAVAGMAGKYTDLLIEALMPALNQLIQDKKWGLT